MINPYIERLTHHTWPAPPRDYSLETVQTRWNAMEAVYAATRNKENFTVNSCNKLLHPLGDTLSGKG